MAKGFFYVKNSHRYERIFNLEVPNHLPHMKTPKIIYYVATIVLTIIMLFSVFNYLTDHDRISGFFEHFNYPTYLVYPLAIAKVLGLVAIWFNFSQWLKEWAYAGFFFNTLLAFFAHYIIDGNGYLFAFLALIATLVSYLMEKQVRR